MPDDFFGFEKDVSLPPVPRRVQVAGVVVIVGVIAFVLWLGSIAEQG